MGIFFTLLYVAMAYVAPTTILGDLAQYHIQTAIVLIALIFSVFGDGTEGLLRLPQTYAIFGLIVSVALSIIFSGWVGGTPAALLEFIPNAMVFFLIVLNFRTRLHLRIMVAVLFLVAGFIITQGALAQSADAASSPYVLVMSNGHGDFYRIRGLDFLSDPNDLSQFLVGLIPCMFLFWHRGKFLSNLLFVFLPVSFLLYGMFLTHSRGGMIALLAVAIILVRRKIGTLPSIITGAVLFAGLSAVGWSGGRDVSADSGADRMEAWSTGLGLIRAHPILGVGYQRFTEYFYITAHNTVVVCAAELGLVGFFFWTLFIVATLRDVTLAARDQSKSLEKENPEQESSPSASPFGLPPAFNAAHATAEFPSVANDRNFAVGPSGIMAARFNQPGASFTLSLPSVALPGQPEPPGEGETPLPAEEIRRLCTLMMLCFTGFLTAGWFLSRSYTMVLFVNTGLAVAVYRIALARGVAPDPLAMGKALKYTGIASVSLITLVYVILRIQNLLPK